MSVVGEERKSLPTFKMTAFVKVFGCRPHEGGAAHSGAGVRKPPREETAGRDTLVVRRALWGFECRERCDRLLAARLRKLCESEAVHESALVGVG
jgi:hypothetical protein